MQRRTRSFLAIALVLVVGAALALYWTQDASPVDLLRQLHGERPSGGHGS